MNIYRLIIVTEGQQISALSCAESEQEAVHAVFATYEKTVCVHSVEMWTPPPFSNRGVTDEGKAVAT